MRVGGSPFYFLLIFSIASLMSCDSGRRNYKFQATFAGAPQFRSVSFLGQSGASLVREPHGDLRVTIDGGQTWEVFPASSVVDGFECATLSQNNRLWAVSHEGRVFTSNYPEASWTEISNLRAAASGDFSGAKQIEMVNETVGWILEALSIWHTKDGGITWTKVLSVLSPGIDGQPTRMFVINETTLLAIGTGQVFLTKDSGATWKIQTVGNKPDLRDVWFSDSKNGWIIGYTSGSKSISMVLFSTKDGGESWIELPYPESEMMPFSLCFVDNDGWISGHRYLEDGSRKPLLLHTDDGGTSWSSVPIPHGDPFVGLIRFSNKSNGWLVGRDSLYRTEDGGKTWKRVLALLPTGN
jgi:photosystem II stability/assembly factor-like uncharacterized protein